MILMTTLGLVPKGEFVAGARCVLRKQEHDCGWLQGKESRERELSGASLVFCCRVFKKIFFIGV